MKDGGDSKVSSGTSLRFVRTFVERTNDSSANEPNWRRNSLSTLEYSTITVLGRDIVLFFTASTNCYFLDIVPVTHQIVLSLTPAGSPRVSLSFCRLSSPSTTSNRCSFFVPSSLLIYVKLGLVGPQGTMLVFFLFIPKTESCPRSRAAASSGLWTVSALLLCIRGLQAQVRIKVFICFTVGSYSIFFPPTVAASYRISALKPVFGRRRWCRDSKGEPGPILIVPAIFSRRASVWSDLNNLMAVQWTDSPAEIAYWQRLHQRIKKIKAKRMLLRNFVPLKLAY